jgi:hypothetical protein
MLGRLLTSMQSPPTRRARIIAAILGAILGGAIVHAQYAGTPGFHTDFGMTWYGARALWNGDDPYALIGPGRAFDYRWPLIYPATALVATMPLAVFSEHVAAVIFVALSTAVLVFAMTRLGWHLMLILLTDSYLAAAKLGQWTTLLTAGVFLPWISFFVLVKPQTSLPVLAGATSKKTLLWAFSGGIGLLALSLVLEPDWPMKWITEVRAAENMEPPIIRLGGFLVLLLLVRWRRPESWLVMVLAAIPQSWGWYGALPLFLIPATFGELILLVGFATLGS